MKKALPITQPRIKAQTKVRPFRHTFETPGTAVVKSFTPNLGVKAMGQTMPNKLPKLKLTPYPGLKLEPIQKRSRNLRNRSAGGNK